MQTNDLGKVVKRVKSISGDSLKISGDNKSYHSPIYDMTHKLDTVIGRVIFKLF
jgi:phage repressor protein C with HTH and peptisase S24 domain